MSNFDYYNFRIKNNSDKINEEIIFYENCEYHNVYPVKEYLIYLKNRIGMDKIDNIPMMHYDGFGNKCEIKKMNLDEYTKDMDIFVFKKPWNKLREFHKFMKIKEFVDGLKYNKKVNQKEISKNRAYLKKEICLGLKNKKFGKHKYEIVYNQNTMIIESTDCLCCNKKTGLYEIDWED